MAKETLTITDNRTGKQYEVPIQNGTIRAMDLRKIKVSDDDFGLVSYDPAFMNTASCRSKITYIDGDKGILRYRGYPIEQLAEKSNYLEVAYLILNGELPTKSQLADWTWHITHHTFIHENIKKFVDGFHHDAHPMGMLVGTIGALSTFYPDAKSIHDAESRQKQIYRLIGKVPTIAAFAYRHSMGMPYAYPDNDLSYHRQLPQHDVQDDRGEVPAESRAGAGAGCFVHTARGPRTKLQHQRHAQYRQLAGRSILGRGRRGRSALWTAAWRRQRRGAAHAEEIGSKQKVPEYIKRVKAGEFRLMGFGHRVYKNYDPRARIIKHVADEVFEVTGKNPLLDIALELERIALEDDYFVSRKLYPNVDFYSGIIYQAMRFPVEMFPVLFAIPRTSGWIAQWQEMLLDPEQKIARPRQIYEGYDQRDFVPMEKR